MMIYLSEIKCLSDLPGAELLEEKRRIHMQRYLKAEDRARCLAAGLMLRCVLGKECAAQVQLSSLDKPFLPTGPCFNLSHSGKWVVLAVDKNEIGVDIEQISPWTSAVAKRVFTASEQRWLQHQGEASAFYRLWTGKEAIMKALGLGFQLPPERFEILPDSIGPNPVYGHSWYLHWREIDGHMLCTASECPAPPENFIILSREQLLSY